MKRYLNRYSEHEIDAVIDRFDLGFMRNRLKSSDEDLKYVMNSLSAASIVLGLRVRSLGRLIISRIRSPR